MQARGQRRARTADVSQSETRLLASELADDTARGWVDQGGRVYLGPERNEGGRKSVQPDEAPKPPEAKK